MKTDFLCPKCRGFLNIGENLVFSVDKKGWNSGIVLLSSELGNYSILHHQTFEMSDGEQFDFYCPICRHNLSVEGVDKFAQVIMSEEGKESFVVFSKIKGEMSTFKISDKKVEAYYGIHAGTNIDFVSASFQK